MIIMGYPGIGKTTVSREDYRFIDLDSGNPLLRGLFPRKNWEHGYCDIAMYLHWQGYFVLVSCHPKVVSNLLARAEMACICYPDISLKDEWTLRLYNRYMDMRNRATHDAWRRAKDHFEEDVEELGKHKCHQIILPSMDYNLKRDILEVHDLIEREM